MSWRDAVAAKHLTDWDALVARLETDGVGLPDGVLLPDVQMAVLHVGEAKGLLKLEGIETDRPGLYFSPLGEPFEAELMALVGGDVAAWAPAVRAVRDAGATDGAAGYFSTLEDNAKLNAERGATVGGTAASTGLDGRTRDEVWERLKKHVALVEGGTAVWTVVERTRGRAIAIVPTGMEPVLETLDLAVDRFTAFQSAYGHECIVAPLHFLSALMSEVAASHSWSAEIATHTEPDAVWAALCAMAKKA